LAGIGGTPVNKSAGKATKLPPPATALIPPPRAPAKNRKMAVCRFKRKFYHECGWPAKKRSTACCPRKQLNRSILKVNARTAAIVVAIAVVIGMPFFTLFGWLSDRIGRKNIIMAGCLIAVLTYIPIYKAMERAAGSNVVSLWSTRNAVTGAISLTAVTTDATGAYVAAKEASNPNVPMLVLLVFIQVIYVCMVYGPIAAYLVEAFPAKIRYTSLSLPYHIGNGVFGGLLPLIGLSVCATTHNIYAGLYYPMAVASLTFIVGGLFLKETHGTKIWDEVGGMK